MSDIQTTHSDQSNNNRIFRKKKISVDLTPMVDLGFLLITFFLLTASLTNPSVAALVMPKDDIGVNDSMLIPADGALTFLNGKDNLTCYYEGENSSVMMPCSSDDIRKIILRKKHETTDDKLFISIKPGDSSTYRNMVDMLDEMKINDIKKYAVSKMNETEKQMMGQIENISVK